MPTRVLLADDHTIVREGLKSLLAAQTDLEVIAEASTGLQAVEFARQYQPDLIIIDIAMPDLNGVEATRQILRQWPWMKVLGLSMHSDTRLVRGLLQAGASGYLLKDSAFEDLAAAITCVLSGEIYLSPRLTGVVLQELFETRTDPGPASASRLSAREREVLQLIAEGRSTKEVAVKLGISPKTAESHRQNIMKKLQLWSIAELTRYALREGLTSLEH